MFLSACTFEEERSPVMVPVVSGACMMIDRALFTSVGGFSPEYFMYGEDVDLCHKVTMMGFHNYYLRAAQIVHHGGGTTRRISLFAEVMTRESVYRFLVKTRGRVYAMTYRIVLSGAALVRVVSFIALLPMASVAGRYCNLHRRLVKWMAILRWGVGLEHWVRKQGEVKRVAPQH
jgi:GT2 family glycosyltransferase